MKARGLKEVTVEASKYAERRALQATYKEANRLASIIQEYKASGSLGGKLLDAAFPFTKTPLNIVSRAIEYSPAGLFRVLFSRNRPPEEIIELFSKGLTGTGIVLLGYLLAAWGWARGSDDTKKKGEELTKLSGDHLYSITTPNGSYKHDWAQPFSVPFFMGVVAEDKMEKQDEFSFETVFDASHISMPKGNKGKSQALPSSITSNKLIKVLKSLEHIKLSDMLKVVMRCGREKQMAELTLPQLYCVRKYRWEH